MVPFRNRIQTRLRQCGEVCSPDTQSRGAAGEIGKEGVREEERIEEE